MNAADALDDATDTQVIRHKSRFCDLQAGVIPAHKSHICGIRS